jgi:hypothetical protein
MTATGEVVLNLRSAIAPARTITIDDVPYELYNLDHLSPNDEAVATALLARHQYLRNQLSITPDVAAGTELARKVHATLVDFLAKLTNAPKDVLTNLPTSAQADLLEAIELHAARDDGEPGDGI